MKFTLWTHLEDVKPLIHDFKIDQKGVFSDLCSLSPFSWPLIQPRVLWLTCILSLLATYSPVRSTEQLKEHNYLSVTKVLKSSKCRVCSESIYFQGQECTEVSDEDCLWCFLCLISRPHTCSANCWPIRSASPICTSNVLARWCRLDWPFLACPSPMMIKSRSCWTCAFAK